MFQELLPAPDCRATRIFQLNQTYTHRVIDINGGDRLRRIAYRMCRRIWCGT